MKSFFNTKESTENKDHGLWVEKYRPTQISEYIGNDDFKQTIEKSLEQNSINHLLLYGPAGSGKTTAAKMLVNSIECDSIYINASDERKIDDVRTKIKGFAASVGFKSIKIIILDESEFLTPESQAALRSLMETFSKHCRFILTCNYIEKIIKPIRSRCQEFEIIPPSKKDICIHLAKILKLENIEFKPSDVQTIVNKCYPDIRKVINTSQQNCINGTLQLSEKSIKDNDVKQKVIQILKSSSSNKLTEIRQLIADNSLSTFDDMFTVLYENVDEYAKGNVGTVIIQISEHMFHDSFVVDKEINFMSCIVQILEEIK